MARNPMQNQGGRVFRCQQLVVTLDRTGISGVKRPLEHFMDFPIQELQMGKTTLTRRSMPAARGERKQTTNGTHHTSSPMPRAAKHIHETVGASHT